MIFFFNDTATTEIYTLSLHDALPILGEPAERHQRLGAVPAPELRARLRQVGDGVRRGRSEEHTSELQSQSNLVCRLLLEKKKQIRIAPCSFHIASVSDRTISRPLSIC